MMNHPLDPSSPLISVSSSFTAQSALLILQWLHYVSQSLDHTFHDVPCFLDMFPELFKLLLLLYRVNTQRDTGSNAHSSNHNGNKYIWCLK